MSKSDEIKNAPVKTAAKDSHPLTEQALDQVSGGVKVHDIVITKKIDVSSPTLFTATPTPPPK